MRLQTAVALALSLVPAAAVAQVPVGGEFRVNTYTSLQQVEAALAADDRGNFVVVWWSYGQDGSGAAVIGQRYDAAGLPQGGEFQVNTYTTGFQGGPSVARAPNGRFVVVWKHFRVLGDVGIFGQRYDAAGVRLGDEFHINTFTTDDMWQPVVAMAPDGKFVVVWSSDHDGDRYGMFGQRYDAAGARLGAEFQVNTHTTDSQRNGAVTMAPNGSFVVVWNTICNYTCGTVVYGQRFDASGARAGAEFRVNRASFAESPSIASDADGNFLVVWTTDDGSGRGVSGQRYDASGSPRGGEFRVNTYTTREQRTVASAVGMDASGNFTVTWDNQDNYTMDVFGQRFDAAGAPRGAEFRANTSTTGFHLGSSVASDPNGNFLVTWADMDGSSWGIFGQRYGGLVPSALAVDPSAGATSDGNGVFEPGEAVVVAPSWRNMNGLAQAFTGTAAGFGGPAGPTYSITDAAADYGTVANGAAGTCTATGNCYVLSIAGARPLPHWDAVFREDLAPASQGQSRRRTLHVGDSFTDVPRANPFYRFIETLLHAGVTGGCGSGTYCPGTATTREQMAVFVLGAKEGAGYAPPACVPPNVFDDVPESSPFCRFIEELSHRGVVGGCGPRLYCPGDPVTREQMAVFVLRTLDQALDPPACAPPNLFDDVPESSSFCRWVEELARRGVVAGCSTNPPRYCPTSPVTREQMSVFLGVTFGLTLYGP